MFYIKVATKTGDTIYQITDKNVYTKFPECGKDHTVNLEEIIRKDF